MAIAAGAERDLRFDVDLTPSGIVEFWNESYRAGARPDWELIDPWRLSDFLRRLDLDFSSVRRVLDIGCGSGLPSICALIGNNSLNHGGLCYYGIDFSEAAVLSANARLTDVIGNVGRSIVIGGREINLPEIRSRLIFQRGDLSAYRSDVNGRFDLVIDWMCSHDMYYPEYNRFIHAVKESCDVLFIRCVFDNNQPEGISGAMVHNNRNVAKRRFSMDQVQHEMLPEFELFETQFFPAELNPEPAPKDLHHWAKRAYALTRQS